MKVLAHRGAPGDGVRENTLAAFAKAVRRDADGIETDVRATRDGLLVLHHDRLLADGRPLAALHAADLAALPADLRPETLDAALAAWPDLLWNLELKDRQALAPLERRLAARPPAQVLVSSFDHEAVRAARFPAGVRRGVLLAHRPALAWPGALPPGPREPGGVDAVVIDVERLDPTWLARARERGLAAWVWGPVTQAEHDALRDLPLEAVITDHVERLVDPPITAP